MFLLCKFITLYLNSITCENNITIDNFYTTMLNVYIESLPTNENVYLQLFLIVFDI